eukprot:CAMPEP_0194131058 /NCGR_PEP_ID=MMETSP0152-20130528/1905_1 /TAXON_ID=1049557 /ORGANISM="Thalassiothrix antarctica, Strain L6-D1" /LENGTH=47 /DNA_ID= /DNA_START= /DNA_END= /DNA_ORIENTATION=
MIGGGDNDDEEDDNNGRENRNYLEHDFDDHEDATAQRTMPKKEKKHL